MNYLHRLLLVLMLLLPATQYAQEQLPVFRPVKSSSTVGKPAAEKMPCPGSDPLTITVAPVNAPRNSGPGGEYILTYEATGATLYFTQIIQGGTTLVVFNGNRQVFETDPGEPYSGMVSSNTDVGDCLGTGTWALRVWSVMDTDGDLRPDRDGNGEIIGCYVESTFTHNPSCPSLDGDDIFEVDLEIDYCDDGASIRLRNIMDDLVHCIDDGRNSDDFFWDGPGSFTANGTQEENLPGGDYDIILTDFYGCQYMVEVNVPQVTPLTLICEPVTTPSTSVSTDGEANIYIIGGSGSYTISWTGPTSGSVPGTRTDNIITGLSSGDYEFTVTDASGCDETCDLEIDTPPCSLAATPTVTDASCDGVADGTLTLTTTNAVAPVTYDWADDTYDGQSNLTGLTAGSYPVTVSDAAGCVVSLTATVSNGPPPTVSLTATQEVSCAGGNDGSLTATPNGNGPFSYAWSPAALPPTADQSALAAGTYAVTVQDVNGCTDAGSLTLADPAPLTLSCSATDESTAGAADGSLAVTVSGAVNGPGAQIQVAFPDGSMQVYPLPTLNLPNLPAGNYQINVLDANGCADDCSALIAPGSCGLSAAVTSLVQPDCGEPTGSATVTPTAAVDPVAYQWNDGRTQATESGLAPGDYTITVTDNAGCTDMVSLTITAFTGAPELSAATATPACPGGGCTELTLSATGTGPYTIAYDYQQAGGPVGQATFTVSSSAGLRVGLCPADLSLTDLTDLALTFTSITDANGCSRPTAVFVDVPTITPLIGTIDTLVCPGGSAMIHGERFDGARPSGRVSLTGAASSGCDSLIDVTLSFRQPAVGSVNPTVCRSGNFSLGGVIFDAATPAGTVTLPGASVNGCDSTVNVTLVFIDPSPGSINPTVCSTGNFILGGTVFNAVNPSGQAVLPGASVDGCDSTVNVTLTFANPPSGNLNPTICTTGDFILGGVTFNAANPSGQAVLPGASVNGCDSTVNVTLTFANPPPGNLNPTVCTTGDFIFGGVTFNAGNPTGQATLPGAAAGGCDSVVNVTLSFASPAPGSETLTLCEGDDFTLGGIVFDAGNPSGRVSLPGAAVGGCDSIVDVSLSFFPPAVGDLAVSLCPGGDFTLGGTVFDGNNPSGQVTLPGAAANGCDSLVNVSVTFLAPAGGDLSPVLCAGESFTLGGMIFDAATPSGQVVLPAAATNGCDSLVDVAVSFHPPAMSTLSPQVCTGGDFTLAGVAFDAGNPTGQVVLPGASINGCDSTVTVNLSIVSSVVFDLNRAICAEETVTVAGETFGANRLTGSITIPNGSASGCDSVVNVGLTLLPPPTGTLDTVVCGLTELTVGGVTLTAAQPSASIALAGASASGCDSTLLINATFLTPARRALDTTLCAGELFSLNGVDFSPASPNGEVTLPGSAANGCDSIVAVSVTYRSEPDSLVVADICPGTAFSLGSQTFTAPQVGTRVLLPTPSALGCERYAVLDLSVTDPGRLTLAGNPVVCPDNLLRLTVTNSGSATATFALSDRPGERLTVAAGETLNLERVAPPGTFIDLLDPATGSGCTPVATGSLLVQASDLTVAVEIESGDGIFAVSCPGGDDGLVTARSTGGAAPYAYVWSTGSSGESIRNLPEGTYTVTVTDAAGCTAENGTALTAPPALVAAVAELPANCLDDRPGLVVRDVQGGSSPYLVGVDPAAPLRQLNLPADTLRAAVGAVELTIEDAAGCVLTQAFQLAPAPEATAIVSPASSVVTAGDSVELRLATDLSDVSFVLAADPTTVYRGNLLVVSPTDPVTTYEFLITGADGCTATASARVIIDDFVPVYAPTAFSPNGDGVNDVYRIFARPRVRSFSNFFIYDRWGNRVFEQAAAYDPRLPGNEAIGWDGGYTANTPNPVGVYFYSVDVETDEGRKFSLKGDVLLTR